MSPTQIFPLFFSLSIAPISTPLHAHRVFKVKDCLDHSALPMDGATLTEALHQRGINVRYLGSVLEFVDKTPAKAQLEHFYVSVKTVMIVLGLLIPCSQTDILLCCLYPSQRIGISELITRCAKHIFKTYLQVSNALVIDWVVCVFF